MRGYQPGPTPLKGGCGYVLPYATVHGIHHIVSCVLEVKVGGLYRLIRMLWQRRVVRFAFVGGFGIPLNMTFLWLFHSLLHMPMVLAWICAFEPSALINFYLNQRITYSEQRHVQGWEWIRRSFKAQVSQLSGQVVNVLVFAGLLLLGVHYLPADAAGIIAAFSANFLLANRYVFTPATPVVVVEEPTTLAEYESVA